MAEDQKLQAVKLAMEQIEKQYGKGSIMRLGETSAKTPTDVISTGSLALDIALGVGGLPRGRVVEIFGPEASGKCVSADTLIFSEKGILPISAFGSSKIPEFQPQEVFIYSEQCFEKTSHFYNGGKKKTLRVSTNYGFQIEGTPNHCIRVLDQKGNYLFRRLDQLRDTDYIAIQRNQNCFGKGADLTQFIYHKSPQNTSQKDFPLRVISAEIARLMGYLIGDGTITGTGLNKNVIQITVSEEEIIRDLEIICQKVFEENPKIVPDRRTQFVKRLAIHNAKARAFLAYAGLGYWVANKKEIPYSILQSPKEIVANFLSALFTADGSFAGSTIEFCTKSLTLAKQLQVVLLNFNIVARIRQKYAKGYSDPYFNLEISGQQDKKNFAEQIGFTLSRKQKVLREHLGRTQLTHTNLDVIPNLNLSLKRFLEAFRRQIRATNRTDWEIFYDYLPQTPNYSQLSYPRLKKILEHFSEGQFLPEYQYLELLSNLGFFWDKVKTIKSSEALVYDFTVPTNATFFGNGFVNHNTTLALSVIAQAQKQGGTAAFIDAEHALDPTWAKIIGVDLDNLLISQPDTGEQALEIAETLIRSGGVDVVVIDSVAALVPRAEIEGEMGEAMIGVQARLMSQALRKLAGVISKSKTVAIFTNQLRQKIGILFGNPEVTPGGLALKFYASVRLDTRKIETIKEGEQAVGSRHRIKVVKNKVAPPFRLAELDILNTEGISQEGNLLDVGLELGVIQKQGTFLKFGTHMLGQGKEAARIFLKESPRVAKELLESIWKQVRSGKPLAKEISEENIE